MMDDFVGEEASDVRVGEVGARNDEDDLVGELGTNDNSLSSPIVFEGESENEDKGSFVGEVDDFLDGFEESLDFLLNTEP